VFLVTIVTTSSALAVPIDYLFDFYASGKIGTTSFPFVPVHVELHGDTDQIQQSSTPLFGKYNEATGTITIQGVGRFDITPPVGVSASPGIVSVRLGLNGLYTAPAAQDVPAYLDRTYGPVTGIYPIITTFPSPMPTSGGTIQYTGLGDVTFRAIRFDPPPVDVPTLDAVALTILMLIVALIAYRYIAARMAR